MSKISPPANYFCGKLYKHWEVVTPMFEEKDLLAKKTNRGNYVQLLFTECGKKRELISPDSKIMDITDIKGVKRSYFFQKEKDGNIRGQMSVSSDKNGQVPLVIAAKWFLENCFPVKLILKLNKNHPASNIFVPAECLPEGTNLDFWGVGKKVHASEVLVKDFDKGTVLKPKTIVFTTTTGEKELITAENSEHNTPFVNQLGINSDILGQNIFTVV